MASETLFERLMRRLGYRRTNNTPEYDIEYINKLDLEYIQTGRDDGDFRCNFCGHLEADVGTLIDHVAAHDDHVDWEVNVFQAKPRLPQKNLVKDEQDEREHQQKISPPGKPFDASETSLFGDND